MSDVEQLLILIDGILEQSTNKEQREAAENTLVQLRTAKPNELMLAFLIILGGSQYKIEHRNFAATQMRLSLSMFSPSTYTNVWSNLTIQTQNNLKIQLFQILFNEPDLSMKKHIADTLGEIAGSVLSNQKTQNEWPEFKMHLWEMFKSENAGANLAAFYVLETFLPFSPETFKENSQDLFALFQNGLRAENPKMKLSALNAFSSYLQGLEPQQHKPFKSLILDIFNAVYILLTNDNQNEEGLEALSEMLDAEHKFFKNNFKELNILMQNIFKIPKIESGVKTMATEILVDYSEKSPALFRKNLDCLKGMLEMIIAHMVEIDEQITDEWKSPPEGYSDDMEDDDDFQTTKFGMGAIDRIIYSVGDKEVLPVLSQLIKSLFTNQDWRYHYTAIMALSQVGEYMEDVSHISSIIEMIATYLTNANPMLRYAACHAVGQISDDLQPKFQEVYGEILYPKLVALLQDPIPRVVSHSAAALTNFLEGMKYQSIMETTDQLMTLLINHSTSGISLVKESCLSTISSVSEVCKENFLKYLDATALVLFKIIETHTSKQYKQLRGQAIETLTIIASSIGADNFRCYLDKLVNIMIAIQESNFEQTDPQKNYILAGWQRLCLVYGKQLSSYLSRILPSLFILVQNVINNEISINKNPEPTGDEQKKDKEGKQESINTYETEEAEIAISMLNVFIEQLKDLYSPYVNETVNLLCKIIKEHQNDDVRLQACKCLPNLVSAVKTVNQQGAVELTKLFMQTLIETIENEFDSDLIIAELETLKNVLEDLNLSFLNEQQITAFSAKVLQMLNKSEESKKDVRTFMNNGGEVDDEDKQIFEEEIQQEEEVQVAISELIGAIFKTHKDLAIPLAQHIISNILPSVLKPNLSETTYKFAIFLIDDMVEFLGYERLESHWEQFGKVLMGFNQEKSVQLRQAACYGLGVYAQNTPTNNTNIISQWLKCLVDSSKISKGSEKQKAYGHCHDNAIASIGKIIKAHGEKFDCQDYLQYWLTFLPLKFDKSQALIEHEFLVDIMLNKPQLILGQTNQSQLENIVKVLKIYGNILSYYKLYNEVIQIKIKQHIISLQSVPLFVEQDSQIWMHLSEKQRQNIKKLMMTA